MKEKNDHLIHNFVWRAHSVDTILAENEAMAMERQFDGGVREVLLSNGE